MTRFRGPIGINRGVVETSPGIYTPYLEEITVYGEIRNVGTSWSQQNANETVKVQQLLSVVTPEDSDIDFNEVVYIVWKNRKWAVRAIKYVRPRVELTLGGLYNG